MISAGMIAVKDYTTADPYDNTSHVLLPLIEHDYVVVVHDKAYHGILSIQDVVGNPKKLIIDCMTPKQCIDFDQDLNTTLSIMNNKKNFVMPVFKDNSFFGAISIKSILDFLLSNEKNREINIPDKECMENFKLLVSGFAHDINNILTYLFGEVDIMTTETNSSALLKRLSKIQIGLHKIAELSQRQIYFSKHAMINKERHSIKQSISEILNLFIDKGHISTCIDIPYDIAECTLDKIEFSQVFSNIIVNSLQSMPRGGKINIKAENITLPAVNDVHLKPGCFIKLTVQDTGCGIKEEYLNKIFDLFYTTKPEGNGIGLAFCYNILKKKNGLITLNSKEDKGTTVTLFLPAA